MSTIVVHPTNGRFTDEDVLEVLPDANVVEPETLEDVPDVLATVEKPAVVLTNNDSWQDAYLESMDPGDWIATTATGYDIYDFDLLESHGVRLSNMPTVYEDAVGTHAFALAFAVGRQLTAAYDNQLTHTWRKEKAGITDFGDDACCVIGLGHIGEGIAARARAFGMEVRGVKRTVEGYDGAAHAVYTSDDLGEAMDGARLCIVICPLTEETEGMVDAAAIDAMADDGVIVNVARGPIVDEDALVAALDADELLGAGLDVFDDEPLPPDSRLWDRDDVVITPHVAGWSDKYPERALAVFVDQYEAWSADEPIPHRLV